MMITYVQIYGRSDDIVIVEIFEDDKLVFEDEVSQRKFSVNGLFDVAYSHESRGGWHCTVGNIDEDKVDEYDKYKITIEVDKLCSEYSPCLKIQYPGSIVIDGIYGGPRTTFNEVVERYVDSHDRDKLYNDLVKAGLIG